MRIWRVCSSTPRPKPSRPALFDTTVRLRTPSTRTASIRCSGLPQAPKPPDITVMPSAMTPVSADTASAYTFELVFVACVMAPQYRY